MRRRAQKTTERLSHKRRRERRKQMVEAVKRGTPVPAVARQFEVAIPTVRMACQEFEVALD
jgi:hypothetical protein